MGLTLAWAVAGGAFDTESAVPAAQVEASPSEPAPTDTPEPPPTAQLAERTIADPAIDELSGMAASRLHPGVLYGINDSGGEPIVYAIDDSGATVARLRLQGTKNRDWEALAPGWDGDGRPTLWIGDIGDNSDNQQRVRLLQINEPENLVDQAVPFHAYWVTYPDGSHNAETLLIDPSTGEPRVVTKGSGGSGAMYRPSGPLREGPDNALTKVMTVPAGITDGAWELSASGEPRLVLTDYWRLHRYTGDGWASALAPLQLQREALAWPWLAGGEPNDSVLLGSEGTNSQIIAAEVP
jgi:hypothetical protein